MTFGVVSIFPEKRVDRAEALVHLGELSSPGIGSFTRQPARPSKTPPKFHEKTPRETHKERKKARNFAPSPPPPFAPAPFGPPHPSGPHPSDTHFIWVFGPPPSWSLLFLGLGPWPSPLHEKKKEKKN